MSLCSILCSFTGTMRPIFQHDENESPLRHGLPKLDWKTSEWNNPTEDLCDELECLLHPRPPHTTQHQCLTSLMFLLMNDHKSSKI